MVLKSSSKKGKTFYKILSIVSMIVVLTFSGWFVYSNIWSIKKIEILNAKHTDINILKSDIDGFLQKKQFFIIPNDHIILLSKKKIKDFILNTYPSVEEVYIDKTIDKEIIMKIKDRKATGVWCDQNCFFFDDEGVLFKKSFEFTGAVFTMWSIKNNTQNLNFYDKALCADICIDQNFTSFLSKNKIRKAEINNEELGMITEYGFSIKALNNASTTIRNMNFFLNKYEDNLNALDYVDIRFMDKIFYKMR